MLLETRLKDDTYILIDAEPSLGIEKGTGEYHSPSEVMDNMLTLATQVTGRLKALMDGEDAPDRLGVTFGIRVNGSAAVALARMPDDAQFRITAEWTSDRD
jgi:hypothetical protein